MTQACACKRGIFVLRDCGDAAVGACSHCTRPICQEHVASGVQPRTCVECRARREEEKALSGADRSTDPNQTAMYRHRFYKESGYRPFLAGHHDPYYDEYDVRPFDPEMTAGVDAEDEAEGGFFDS